ncbi:hypothetical protein [uncultured Gammaproteobacteria bacterium]|nr:hypothetical protein [uncultured Gammaproteobacteria bacterium]
MFIGINVALINTGFFIENNKFWCRIFFNNVVLTKIKIPHYIYAKFLY